jgi:asparagine synthase (glutamine-hydrolysing)
MIGPAAAVSVSHDPGRAAEYACAALPAEPHAPELFSDGPLAVAWAGHERIGFDASERTACLLVGVLYGTLGDGCPSDGVGAARALAAAFEQRGEQLLRSLRGDFWLLLWDRNARRGLVASDQLGGGGPYWTHRPGAVLICPEVRDLLAALPHTPPPDPAGLAHWLTSTLPPPGATLLAGIHRLPAAHLLRLEPDRPPERVRYWSPRYVAPLPGHREEIVAILRETLTTAVTRRLDPGGAALLLSGGLDSSAVAALSASAGQAPACYSAVFPAHPSVDESELIYATAAQLGLEAHSVRVTAASVLAGSAGYLELWRLPPSSPNLFFWSPLLALAAGNGARAVLDGEGGDELFGLVPFLLADLLRRGQPRAAVRRAHGWPPPWGADTPERVRARLIRFGARGLVPAGAHVLARRVRGTRASAPAWLAPQLVGGLSESDEHSSDWKRLDGPRWWAWLAWNVTRGGGPTLIYEQARRRAAAVGLQARHPLADVEVIELMLRVPPELSFDPRLNRPLLREAVRGLLPEKVRTRPTKSGFDILFHEALAGPELPAARSLLGAGARIGEYVDVALLRSTLLESPPSAGRDREAWATRIWRLVSAECWLRTLEDAAFPERLRELAGSEPEPLVHPGGERPRSTP